MAKRALLLLFLFIAASCGTNEIQRPTVEIKKEMPMWRIVMYKEPDSDTIRYEDKWYRYSLDLTRVIKTSTSFTNTLYGECRYASGVFTVIDKETGAVVREEEVEQRRCNACHNRL